MEASKVPFIGARGVQRTRRHRLKQYRPVSTRPWVLFLFLAATGVCFGLLVAVSLIDRKTTLSTKRDVNGNNERRGLSHREAASASTTVHTTSSSSAILSLTSQTAITTSLTATTEVLSLTSQSASSAASSTAKTTTPLATTEVLSLTSQTTSPESAKVSTATLSLTSQSTITSPLQPSQTFTSTGAILSLTSQSVSSTPSSTEVLSLTSQTTPTTSTSRLSPTFISTAVLSLTSQSVSSTPSSTQVLSLTSQTTSSATPKFTTTDLSLTFQTSTSALLSLTSQSVGAILSLTSQSAGAMLSSTPQIASSTSNSILSLTSQPAASTTNSILSLTSQPAASTTNSILSLSSQSAGAMLSLTPQTATSTSNSILSLTSQPAASTSNSILSLTLQTFTNFQSVSISLELGLTSQTTTMPTATSTGNIEFVEISPSTGVSSVTGSTTAILSLIAGVESGSLFAQTSSNSGDGAIIVPGTTVVRTTVAGTTIQGATIPGTTILEIPVSGTTIAGTTVSGTTIAGTTIAGTTIAETAIPGTTIPGTTIAGIAIPGTTIAGTTIAGTTIAGTTIAGTTIAGTTIAGTTIAGTTIPGTTIPGTTLAATTILPAVIAGTTVTGITLSRTTVALTISGTVISEVIVLGTTIPGTTIPGTTIKGTTRSGTTVAGATVLGTTVSDVTILGTTIPGTTILGTTFDLVPNPSTEADSLTATGTVRMSTKTPDPINSAQPTSVSKHNNNSVDPLINAELVLLNIRFQNYDYFLAMYLPKIIAVIMACLWSIIFAGLKLMEPFYQLSAHPGAFAEETLFGNYLSSELNLSSLSAMFHGQWVLILGGVALLAWTAVVALTSEVMMVISTGTCTGPDGSSFRCDPGWAVSLPILKGLLGVVGLIFVLTFILTWIIARRKRSGVFVDPSSIAAMAELLGNPDVMHDLREIDPLASDREVSSLLAGRRYKLGLYNSVTGEEVDLSTNDCSEPRWGLIRTSGEPVAPRTFAQSGRISYGAVPNPSSRDNQGAKVNRNRRIFQLILDAVTFTTALVIFAIVLGYYLDSKSDPFNNFFNSNNFGPRFVLTGLALILSARWRTISQEVTLMTPYRNMARAFQNGTGAPARRSILAATACTPFTAFHKGLVLRNYLIAAVALSAILSDVLLVAVSGVPFNAGQIKLSLQASSFTSLGILFIMAVTSIAVMIHNRTSAGGTRRLPRNPNTLASVWLYLCGSGLTQHNKGNGDEHSPVHLDQVGMNAKYDGGNYGFARAAGVDGVTRWTVDEAAELHSARPPEQLRWRPMPPAG